MPETYIAYKFRLYPTKRQKIQIDKTIGCCRYVYNLALSCRNDAYKNGDKFPSNKEIYSKLKELRVENSWLTEPDTKALECAIANNTTAFVNFFKGKSEHPVKRKKKSIGSYETQLREICFKKINDNIITLPKLGNVKIKTHRLVDINSIKDYVTISRNTIGEYYISIKVRIEKAECTSANPNKENTIGIDLGVKDLAICHDGTKYHKFKIDKKAIKRKKRLQRKLSKKVGSKKDEKKSNNFLKLRKQIAKIDLKIARKREYYQYEVVNDITSKNCDYISVEDLNVKGMIKKGGNRKKGLNRGLNNASLGNFKIKLTDKAETKGKKCVEIDRWYPSSKICHNCGYVYKQLTLKIRNWTCPQCGEKHDRDINAAINTRNKGVETLSESQKNLSECIGKVKSAESETKQNAMKQNVSSVSALVEPENSIQKLSNNLCKSINYA